MDTCTLDVYSKKLKKKNCNVAKNKSILVSDLYHLVGLQVLALCWVDLGWSPGPHQDTISLPLLNRISGRKI